MNNNQRITYIIEFNNDDPRLPTAALEQVAQQYGGATLSYHQGDVAAGLHHLLNLPQPVLHQLLAHLAVTTSQPPQ